MNNFTEYVLQGILILSADILKDVFFHFGGNISELPDLNNHMIAVEIARRWGWRITEEVAIIVVKVEYILREGAIT